MTTTLPLFYKNPQPINAEKHKQLKLLPLNSFDFAAETNSVPLAATEFTITARYFPIVFTATDDPLPIALLGLESNKNAFVRQGRWQAPYVPAYIRRYPFTFATDAEAKVFTLCIDEGANLLADTATGKELFTENNEPSEFLKEALNFCTQYQKDWQWTHQFTRALKQANLLVPKTANISRPDGQRSSFKGFLVIDEEKFKALDDETFLQWRRSGWLNLVYAHWFSQCHWQTLISASQILSSVANAPLSESEILPSQVPGELPTG